MQDKNFGNSVYALRKNAGLSQNELGKKLGVSGKAVSKWENGNAKPHLDTITKLAALFEVSADSLLKKDESGEKCITKIVITGGPCAGKTTALSRIQAAFADLGYTVIIIPETATELIMGGIAPWTLKSNLDYQLCQMKLQLEKEKIFTEGAAKLFGKDKVLVVCDRGMMDNKAYMTASEFAGALQLLGYGETELRDEYDAVFHLVTAAKGAAAFYTTENNDARTETAEEAAAMDDKLISAWTGHPHFRVIDNSTDFEHKMDRLLAEISAFLGEPEPLEIERKFLIEYPDIKRLEASPACRRVEIIQTYLQSEKGEEVRVRQRGENGNYVYFLTTKRTLSGIKRVELEKRLTKEEYLAFLMDADTSKKQIRKTRYCLTSGSRYFEIDVYPFWKDRAILEIELADENEKIDFPEGIKVIKEVTDDERYKNASLAQMNSLLYGQIRQ